MYAVLALTVAGLLALAPDVLQAQHAGMQNMPGTVTGKQDGARPPGVPDKAFQISPQRQQLIGLTYATVTEQTLRRTVRAVARLEVNERNVRTVNPKIGGWIERLHADFTGQLVRRGAPLLEIYSPELVAAQEEYLVALRAREDLQSSPYAEVARSGQTLYEAARRRLLLWDITAAQIAHLERTRQVSKTMTLYSPFSGFVVEKMAVSGMNITPGMTLYKIADLSTVWLHADLYEYELPLVRPGQKVSFTLSYLPGQSFRGEVLFVYPYLDEKTRTATVRIQVPNPAFQLKPGMYSDVEFAVELGRRLAVPESAVLDTGTRKLVFVDRGNGFVEPRDIKTGAKAGDHYEVIAGLERGDRVVASANFLIDSESKLKEAVGGMKH